MKCTICGEDSGVATGYCSRCGAALDLQEAAAPALPAAPRPPAAVHNRPVAPPPAVPAYDRRATRAGPVIALLAGLALLALAAVVVYLIVGWSLPGSDVSPSGGAGDLAMSVVRADGPTCGAAARGAPARPSRGRVPGRFRDGPAIGSRVARRAPARSGR
jgi:hypothetical protein